MTTVILLRHGRTTANAAGVLAGWTPGVRLDDAGTAQVQAVAQRLAAGGWDLEQELRPAAARLLARAAG